MHNLKILLLSFVLLVLVHKTSAQAPSWTVNPNNYQYTMTVTAFLNVEGKALSSDQDMVAAFVGDETRGVAKLIFVESTNRHLAYLTIYANKESEEIEFKIYNSSNEGIIAVDKTLDFRIDGQYGNVFQAFSLANPALNNEAEIKKFYFSDIDTISTLISEEKVDIEVEYGKDFTSLTPEFIASDGAKIYIERTLQASGDTTLDFSFPITYSVLSEDESVLSTYEISLKNQQKEDSEFSGTNVVTANNDGFNDFWIVQNTSSYNDYIFKIFDANGRILFESIGYQNNWNGYYKGKKLSRGKYYYKVENKEKNRVITGNILVIY